MAMAEKATCGCAHIRDDECVVVNRQTMGREGNFAGGPLPHLRDVRYYQRRGEGTGLGRDTVANAIVKKHRGAIQVFQPGDTRLPYGWPLRRRPAEHAVTETAAR